MSPKWYRVPSEKNHVKYSIVSIDHYLTSLYDIKKKPPKTNKQTDKEKKLDVEYSIS